MMETAQQRPEGSSRLEDFTRYFSLSLALTPQQRAQVYQIRYRVYCEEFGYERAEALGNHQETDEFDCQSVHCLVTHRESGIAAGCVRLVIVDDNDLMPFETYAQRNLYPGVMEQFSGQRHTLCEVSRLAVDGLFRRRRKEWETRFGDLSAVTFNLQEKRTFPLIAFFLFLAAGVVGDILGRKNCFAIMEPFLPAMLNRSGISFERIGTDFEHRGTRAPYHANIDALKHKIPAELLTYFNAMRDDFIQTLPPDFVQPVASEARVA